jgi:hypothetical protein
VYRWFIISPKTEIDAAKNGCMQPIRQYSRATLHDGAEWEERNEPGGALAVFPADQQQLFFLLRD